jgi:hypothetical protein
MKLRLTCLESRLSPAVATWDGGGGIIGNNNWSLPLNWVGDVAPQPGDDLVFGTAPVKVAINDFVAGTLFRSITLSDTNYQISGNAVGITAEITGGFSGGSVIALDIIISGPVVIANVGGTGYTISGGINLNNHVLTATINGGGGIGIIFPGVVSLTGAISGNGRIIKDGQQWLVLSGNNTFAGAIDHRSGHLSFGSNNAGGATGAANLTMVEPGAVLNIEIPNLTIPETITFADSSLTNANQLAIFGSNGSNQSPVTFTGPVTLQGDSRWIGNMTLAGGLFGNGQLNVGGGGPLTFPAGTVNSFSGLLFSEGNALVFNGSGPFGPVFANDIQGVTGVGTIGPLTVQGQTRFRPGDNSIGTLTTGNLIEGAFYEVELGNAGNDRVVVNGSVALGGTLVVQPQAGFTPGANSVFRIIDNDGVDPIAGGFGGLPQGALAASINGVALFMNYRGGDGNDVELTTTQSIPTEPPPFFSVGAGPGGAPQVNVYTESGALIHSFFAYDVSFRGGVHVATADVTGDGVPDVITAPGFGGGPVIRIWDGGTGALLTEYNAYDPNFRGGAFVAAGRMNSDLIADIITGAGASGGPHVKVFNAGTTQVLSEFLAYNPIFLGGVSVGAVDFLDTGSFNDQGIVVTGAGAGGGPHVKTFGGLSGGERASFFAYDATFTGGVFVSGGRTSEVVVNPDDNVRIVVSPGAGRSAEVRVFDAVGVPSFSFLAYDAAFQGGATVAFRPGFDFGVVGVITGAGPGGGPHVKTFGMTTDLSFFAFDPAFTGGVFVG